MDFNAAISLLENVVSAPIIDNETRVGIVNNIVSLKNFSSHPEVCYGIVSAFDSLKSEFYSAAFGNEFFGQEETFSSRFTLKYGDDYDLEVTYTFPENTVMAYSSSKVKLIKEHLMDIYDNLSTSERVKIAVKGMFDRYEKDDLMVTLFKRLTQCSDNVQNIQDVTLYIPSELLRGGISLTNIPMDRCNDHNFDTLMPLLRADNPLPKVLSDAILACFADKTHTQFILAKTALLGSKDKIKDKKSEVAKMVEQKLSLTKPSILIVDETDKASCKGLFTTISEITAKNIIRYKKERSEELIANFRQYIVDKDDAICKTIKLKTDNPIKKLGAVIENLNVENSFRLYSGKVSENMLHEISEQRKSFENYVYTLIDNSTTKSSTQKVLKQPKVIQTGIDTAHHSFILFGQAYASMADFASDIINELNTTMLNLYGIKADKQIKKTRVQQNWEIKYRKKFSRKGMTTFLLFRLFKNLNTIKDQTKKCVNTKLDQDFLKIRNNYIKHLDAEAMALNQSLNKILRNYENNYSNIVDSLIRKQECLIKEMENDHQKLLQLTAELDAIKLS